MNLTWETLFWGAMLGFRGKTPLNLFPLFLLSQKDSSLHEAASFDVLRAQIGLRVWSGRASENNKKVKNKKVTGPVFIYLFIYLFQSSTT